MERRGGCCIAMYGGGGDSEAAWRMGRIMLRFRPIAPKPAAGSSEVTSAIAELSPLGRKTRRRKSSGASSRGRKARKVEARPSPSYKDDWKASASSSSANITTTTCSPTIATLSLMPEADEQRGDTTERPRPSSGSERPPLAPGWIGCEAAARTPWLVTAVGSWVTVENVTDTWRGWEVAWRSDEAVRAALAADECPGLVSDEWDRVTWTNEAYRRMVAGDGSDDGAGRGRAEEEEEEVRVGLVVRAAVPAAGACRAFTCRMRVHYGKRPGRALSSLAAPCDVWRLDDGGRAWRIDVMAALSLSR